MAIVEGELPFSKKAQTNKNKVPTEKTEISRAKHKDLIKKFKAYKLRGDKAYGTMCIIEPNISANFNAEGSAIPDMLELTKIYDNLFPRIYEIKVSRGDFLGDVRSGKYKKYFEYCRKFYFILPEGLIDCKEIPEGCGYIEHKKKGSFRYRVNAPTLGGSLEPRNILALLFKLDNELKGE